MSSTAKYVPKKKKRELKKSIVDHTYRDFSRFTAKELMGADYAGRVREGQFPAKLHDILSTGEYAHIIAWRPHGRAWAIIDKKKLTEIVMPRYFDTRKFSTFNRSINGWGFKRLCGEGPDHHAYYHELFLRGKLHHTSAMRRLRNPGKRLPNEQREPDFYEMSKKYPLLGSLDAPPFTNEEASTSWKHAPSLSSSAPVETPSRSSNPSAGNCLHGYPHGYHTPGPSCQAVYSLVNNHRQKYPHGHHFNNAQPAPYYPHPPNHFHNHSASEHSCYPSQQITIPPVGSQRILCKYPHQQGPPIVNPRQWYPSSSDQYCSHPLRHDSTGYYRERNPSNQYGNIIANNEVNKVEERKTIVIEIPVRSERTPYFLESFNSVSTTMKSWQYNAQNHPALDPAPGHPAITAYPPSQMAPHLQLLQNYFLNHSALDQFNYSQQQVATPAMGSQNVMLPMDSRNMLDIHPTPQGPASTQSLPWRPASQHQYCLHPPSHASLGHYNELANANRRGIAAECNEVHDVDERKPAATGSPSRNGRTQQFLEGFTVGSAPTELCQYNVDAPFELDSVTGRKPPVVGEHLALAHVLTELKAARNEDERHNKK